MTLWWARELMKTPCSPFPKRNVLAPISTDEVGRYLVAFCARRTHGDPGAVAADHVVVYSRCLTVEHGYSCASITNRGVYGGIRTDNICFDTVFASLKPRTTLDKNAIAAVARDDVSVPFIWSADFVERSILDANTCSGIRDRTCAAAIQADCVATHHIILRRDAAGRIRDHDTVRAVSANQIAQSTSFAAEFSMSMPARSFGNATAPIALRPIILPPITLDACAFQYGYAIGCIAGN